MKQTNNSQLFKGGAGLCHTRDKDFDNSIL